MPCPPARVAGAGAEDERWRRVSDTNPPENPKPPESQGLPPATPSPWDIRVSNAQGVQVGVVSSQVFFFAAATATLVPFLQALGTVVGTRIGERLDDATRGALRRMLRRELEQATPGASGPASIRLSTTSGGTRIQLDAGMPEEALPQLLSMTFERLEEDGSDAPALVRWTQAGWLATVARSGQLCDLIWDAQREDWVPTLSPPTSTEP